MSEDLVMRSLYLRPSEDAKLRQLALDLNVTKSDLIRAAVGLKLKEWLGDNSKTRAAMEVEAGLRETTRARRVRQELPSGAVRFSPSPKAAAPKAAAVSASRATVKSSSSARARRRPKKVIAKS